MGKRVKVVRDSIALWCWRKEPCGKLDAMPHKKYSECGVDGRDVLSRTSCSRWLPLETDRECTALQQAQPFSQPLVDAMHWFEATGGPATCGRVLDLGHERPTFTALQFIFVEGKTSTSFPSVLWRMNGSLRRSSQDRTTKYRVFRVRGVSLYYPLMLKVRALSLCWCLVAKHIKNMGAHLEKTMRELMSQTSSSDIQVSECKSDVQCFPLCRWQQ